MLLQYLSVFAKKTCSFDFVFVDKFLYVLHGKQNLKEIFVPSEATHKLVKNSREKSLVRFKIIQI